MIPVLVTSGKGGVGKSTVSINLALALIDKGFKVSLLDADLMDPVQHLLFNVNKETIREYGKMLTPINVSLGEYRLEFMGLGPFIPRGVGVALNYEKTVDFLTTLLKHVKWSGDFLVVDCPPGAIDVNKKLFDELRNRARAVVVGEPHIFAFEDNLRMLDMLKFHDIDVRAVVLNKVGLFQEDISKMIEEEYSKLGYKIIKIPWDPALQTGFKPELFKELAEAVVA
jgi:ATP-binding protein involved in chromosome partitioning